MMTSLDFVERVRLHEISFTFGNDAGQTAEERIQEVVAEMLRIDSKLVLIKGKSPQLHMRTAVMVWMKTITGVLGLLRKTLFLGVYLCDRFMDRHDVAEQQIYLVALICLHLAAKLEENQDNVPKMATMNRLLPSDTEYTVHLFLAVEKIVLNFFNYKLLFPTYVDIYEYFVLFAVEATEIEAKDFMLDENNNNNNNMAVQKGPDRSKYVTAFECIQQTAKKFMYLVMEETESGKCRPSLLAATAVMTSRIVTGLSPWTPRLERVTTYQEAVVEGCLMNFLPQFLNALKLKNLSELRLTLIKTA